MKRSIAFSNLGMLSLLAALFAACSAPAWGGMVTHVPLYTFHGDSAGTVFGRSVSGAGDVNGDGHADLIVGILGGSNNGTAGGSARVLSGIDGSTLYTFYGDSQGDYFGLSVSGAGDVNGDGHADLIVGAVGDDDNGSGSGNARVLSGTDGSTLYAFYGDSPGDHFGLSVSGAGDVNGDGHADLIVGAEGDDDNGDFSGSARVLSGIDGSTLYTFHGNSKRNHFGKSVSGAGDVNGDGHTDLIVGASKDHSIGILGGSARVLSGIDGSTLYTFGGHSMGGRSVGGAGDVNGDGHADLIFGDRRDDSNGEFSGSAHVLSGVDGTNLYTFYGDSEGDFFGWSVSSAGDVNGDGHADLIVGAPLDGNNGAISGSARVLSGIDGSTLYTFHGDSPGDRFGMSVSGAGDVNGDGLSDFIVGVWSSGINNGGYARVFVSQIVPEPSSLLLLVSFAGAGLLGRRRQEFRQ